MFRLYYLRNDTTRAKYTCIPDNGIPGAVSYAWLALRNRSWIRVRSFTPVRFETFNVEEINYAKKRTKRTPFRKVDKHDRDVRLGDFLTVRAEQGIHDDSVIPVRCHRLEISNRIPGDQSFPFSTIGSGVKNFPPLGPCSPQRRMNNAHSQTHYTREKSSLSPTLYEKTTPVRRDRWSSLVTEYSFVTEAFFQSSAWQTRQSHAVRQIRK